MSKVKEIKIVRSPHVLIEFYTDNPDDYAQGKCARPNLYLHSANMNTVMRAIDKAVRDSFGHYVWHLNFIDYDEDIFEYYIEVTIYDPLVKWKIKQG